MLGLDQVLVNMISIIIGGVGLVGAITKFDVANSKKSFYGENPFASKEEIINTSIVQWFTAYTAVGLIFQVFFGLIFGDLIPDRLYPRFVYVIVLVLAIPYSYALIKLLRWMGTKFSKGKWQSDIVNRFKGHYESVEFIIENDGRSKDDGETNSENTKISNYKTAEEIIDRLEELFDLSPSNEDNIAIRAKRFKKYFRT